MYFDIFAQSQHLSYQGQLGHLSWENFTLTFLRRFEQEDKMMALLQFHKLANIDRHWVSGTIQSFTTLGVGSPRNIWSLFYLQWLDSLKEEIRFIVQRFQPHKVEDDFNLLASINHPSLWSNHNLKEFAGFFFLRHLAFMVWRLTMLRRPLLWSIVWQVKTSIHPQSWLL